MKIDGYLGFRIGDVVLDLAELTVGTATIKDFQLVASEWANGPTVLAVMEQGAQRYVIQLKKVRPVSAEPVDDDGENIVHLRPGGR